MAAGPSEQAVTADAFADRLLAASLGWVETMSIYLGDRLGWYRSLVADGPSTSTELAERTRTHERYAREWLEQQAVYGIIRVEEAPDQGSGTPRYALGPGPAEVLTDERSLSYLGPLPRMFASSGVQLPALLDAYRNGGGVSWEQLGDDARQSQADLNRPWFDELPRRLASVPEVHRVLGRRGARIADVGSGAGWSSIALGSAYPESTVDGFDVDRPSVELARGNSAACGVSERVRFHAVGADQLASTDQRYDAVFAFECLHDMPRPVEVLAAIRAAIKPDGLVVIMDEAVADTFSAPGDELERLMYGFSLFICLPDGLSDPPSVGTGTVLRKETLQRYAREAGFSGLEVLPIEEFGFWRFYRLFP